MKLFSSALFKTLVRLALIVGVLSFLVRFNGASIYVSESEYRNRISLRHGAQPFCRCSHVFTHRLTSSLSLYRNIMLFIHWNRLLRPLFEHTSVLTTTRIQSSVAARRTFAASPMPFAVMKESTRFQPCPSEQGLEVLLVLSRSDRGRASSSLGTVFATVMQSIARGAISSLYGDLTLII
jgi:hypothetical protein